MLISTTQCIRSTSVFYLKKFNQNPLEKLQVWCLHISPPLSPRVSCLIAEVKPVWSITFKDPSVPDKSISLKGQILKETNSLPSKQHPDLGDLWAHSQNSKNGGFRRSTGIESWLTINNQMRFNSAQPLTLPFGLKLWPRPEMPQYSEDTVITASHLFIPRG